MTQLNSYGTFAIIIIFAVYVLYTLAANVLSSNNSLRNTEGIHRFLLVSGGLFIGLGIGTLGDITDSEYLVSIDVLISLLLSLAGIVFILFGISILKNSLWVPLEQMSEYSAEFGVNFVATRLPLLGDRELVRFSERFNKNAIILANKISELEIYLETLNEAGNNTIHQGTTMIDETSSLTEVADNFSETAIKQSNLMSNLSNHLDNFVKWYDETQVKLKDTFVELRSLSEMGNLISINAAVEASNLEIPNPGFETLAAELRELAKNLEEKMEVMRSLIDDIFVRYEDFRTSIQKDVTSAVQTSETSQELSDTVAGILESIKDMENQFVNLSEIWKRRITSYTEYLPRAFF